MDILYIAAFITLVAIFLLGISWMRIGLFNLSGKKLEQRLKKVTKTPAKGMFAGIVMTSILQSSSAVMLITIGFVATRLLLIPANNWHYFRDKYRHDLNITVYFIRFIEFSHSSYPPGNFMPPI